MKITKQLIADKLFRDESISFEEMVELLKIESTCVIVEEGILSKFYVPSMDKKIEILTDINYYYNFESYINHEYNMRQKVIHILQLEDWLNCPIDYFLDLESPKYFFIPNFLIINYLK